MEGHYIFKEANLNYLTKRSEDERLQDAPALKILYKHENYICIVERCLINFKSLVNELQFTKKHAYISLTNSKWYFCLKEFKCLALLYLHYISQHHEVSTKVYIKKERKKKTIFMVIEEREASSSFHHYQKKESFYNEFDFTSRKIQLDCLLWEEPVEELQTAADLAEFVYEKMTDNQTSTEKQGGQHISDVNSTHLK